VSRGIAVFVTLVAISLCSLAEDAMPTGASQELTAEQVDTFASLALGCVDTSYPYKTGHVLTGKDSLAEPRTFHPVFYGCFDWHSAVHGHWTLVRLLRLYPDHPKAAQIRKVLDGRFTADAFKQEAAFFDRPQTRSFERPYGWAWLLRLAQELHTWKDEDAARWAKNIAPLENAIASRLKDYLPKLSWPIRTGVHPNTAFALAMALDYAEATGKGDLASLIRKRARAYYVSDENCPVDYEPSGEDFFSPCLLEADLMRRVLPAEAFSKWLDGFLPRLKDGDLGGLSEPATVSDASDPKIVHLDGLNLVRAWTMDGIAHALADEDARRKRLLRLASRHADVGSGRVASGHYEGEHWLA
jgi:hypothetical protein